MKPPTQSDKKVIPAVMLTAKERKKMRRQNRAESLKEEQEKIRLGLLPPPEPKGKLMFNYYIKNILCMFLFIKNAKYNIWEII